MTSNGDKYRSRKWILSWSTELLAVLGLVTGYLDGDNFQNISIANVSAYNFANAAQYFKQR